MSLSNDYRIDALLYQNDATRWNTGAPVGSAAVVTYSFMDQVIAEDSSQQIANFRAMGDDYKTAVRQVLGQYSTAARIQFVEVADSSSAQLRYGMYSGRAGIPAGIPNDGESFVRGYSSGHAGDVWINHTSSKMADPAQGGQAYQILVHETGHALGLKHPGSYSSFDLGPFLPAAEDTGANTVMSYNGSITANSGLGPYDVNAVGFLYGPRAAGQYGLLFAGDDQANTVTGDAGDNVLQGYDGNDSMTGGDGNDVAVCGGGSDFANGNLGNDSLNGNAGDDTVRGGQGDDSVRGGQGSDCVYGDLGSDQVFGDVGNDTVYGGKNNDTIHGGQGDDLLFGDMADDQLWGDRGNDTLTGGVGADLFCFAQVSGADTVADFNAADGDRLQIAAGLSYSLTANGAGDAVISLSAEDSVTITGIKKDQFSTNWIVTA